MEAASTSGGRRATAQAARGGWYAFGGLLFILVGAINALQGLIAIFKDDYFAVTKGGLLFADFAAWGTIAPNVGATINFGGLESMVYGGMVWHVPVAATPFFTEAALGAALHNGALSGATAPARNLGCSLLFHEQVSLGANLSPTTSVMLTAEHASSANLCLPNEGLTNIGVRVGFKF